MRTARPFNRRPRAGLSRVMAIPALLLLASIAGLVLGLTGDGMPDVVAWALLSIPIILSALAFLRRG